MILSTKWKRVKKSEKEWKRLKVIESDCDKDTSVESEDWCQEARPLELLPIKDNYSKVSKIAIYFFENKFT